MAFGDTIRERARQRTARQKARQAARAARRESRQAGRSARSSGRQTTRQMRIQAKGASGYWSPEAVAARSSTVSTGLTAASGAATSILAPSRGAQNNNGTTSKSPVSFPLLVGGIAAGFLVYFATRK